MLKVIIESHIPGLPLGNLTSQLLVNIYLNEFDQFMKHELKVKCYIRYADDFVVLSQIRGGLETLLIQIRVFLKLRLNLDLHPNKVSIETLGSGVDFLGWVHFTEHRVLRTVTKRRMLKKGEEGESCLIFGDARVGKGVEVTVCLEEKGWLRYDGLTFDYANLFHPNFWLSAECGRLRASCELL